MDKFSTKDKNINSQIEGERISDLKPATDIERVELFFRHCQQKTFQPLQTCQHPTNSTSYAILLIANSFFALLLEDLHVYCNYFAWTIGVFYTCDCPTFDYNT